MSGQPAARQTDRVKGGVIVTGSATVLIGSQGVKQEVLRADAARLGDWAQAVLDSDEPAALLGPA